MSQAAPGPGQGSLPVLGLVVEAWRLAFERIGDFAFLAAAPALALCGLSALGTIVTGDQPSALWLLGEQLMSAFIWGSLGVSWSRFVLLGERNKAAWGELPFGAREARFFLYTLAARAPGVALVLLMSRGEPERFATVVFLCALAQVLIMVMFPLVFPATAVDRDGGFLAAWRLVRSSALRLFAASILAALPLLALVIMLVPIAGLGAGTVAGVLFSPFEVVPALGAQGIIVVVVALAYRRRTGAIHTSVSTT